MPKIVIYALSNPNTNIIMYIGKTKQPLIKRLMGHVYCSKYKNSPRDNWIKSLILMGVLPSITEIEEVGLSDWIEREKYWITTYKKQNPNLTNLYNGGSGPSSELHFKKMSEIKSKKLLQLDSNLNIIKLFNSCKEAQNITKITHISKAANNNKIRTAGGYIWVYECDYEDFIKNTNNKHFILDRSILYKKVKMYDKNNNLLKVFDSVKDAGKETKIPYRMICSAARGFKRSCKGYIWKYEEENEYKYKRK